MRKRSILGQIAITAGIGVMLFVGLWTCGAILWLYAGAIHGLDEYADRQSRELSAALAPLVWNLDERSIQTFIDTKTADPEILSIEVNDLYGDYRWTAPHPLPGLTASTTRLRGIVADGKTIGSVTVKLTMAPRLAGVTQTILSLALSQFLLFMAIMAAVAISWRSVVLRLRDMERLMEAFSNGGTEARMAADREDELSRLAMGFNLMADRIEATTQSMEKEILERTNRLMESEKLALVGSLVAGVAHEINTPIGNGITITSWLAGRTREVQAMHREDGLVSDELELFLSDVESSLEVLQSGLDRTSNLIQTFKKIGTDQVVDERRILWMHSFLHEVVASLNPTLKRFPHTITIVCPLDFSLDNHPGALFQIVTNLVLNAHLHAFSPEQEGTITLEAGPVEDDPSSFFLCVCDNGVGIPAEITDRIFQPFFTTKRLEGGTGLGLSIVHTLVKNLGGSISVRSAPGHGSEFLVNLPLSAPNPKT